MAQELISVDFHTHSCESQDDSITVPTQLDDARRKKGISLIAVTDHNNIGKSVKEQKDWARAGFIIGEEILTCTTNEAGNRIEVAGLFLRHPIESGWPLAETAYQVADQGGVVVIVHPFDLKRHGAGMEISSILVGLCIRNNIPVAFEVFNSRVIPSSLNNQALQFWERELRPLGIPATAGSDAHRMQEVGNAYVEMRPWNDVPEFMESLRGGKVVGSSRWAPWHRGISNIERKNIAGRPVINYLSGVKKAFSYPEWR